MNFESLIASLTLIITVVGWYITYTTSIKAQNKAFLHQITNDARLAIYKAISNYQKWLAEVVTSCLSIDLQEEHLDTNKLLYNYSTEWIFTLEEYEILFPETRDVRILLLERDGKIRGRLSIPDIDLILDQISLTEDLKKYIQNKALSEITGNVIPERELKHPSVPRIVFCNGKLTIKEGNTNTIS